MDVTLLRDRASGHPDGDRLSADVWMPAKVLRPPVLIRTPYSRSLAPVGRPLDVLQLLDAGIPVVVQDVRGRGTSEGSFEPFVGELADTAETISWLTDQPWCLGPPSMTGPSYMGHVQLQALTEPELRLSAISPQFSPLDIYDDWAYRQGVFQLGTAKWWHHHAVALAGAVRAGQHADASTIRGHLDRIERGYGNMQELESPADIYAPSYRQWVMHTDRDSYWDDPSRSPRSRLVQAGIRPALLTGGWFDVFLRATLRTYHLLRTFGGDPHLIIGPWSHVSTTGEFPNASFGARASAERLDLTGIHARFFAAAADEAVSNGPPVRIFMLGQNHWIGMEHWPPPEATKVEISLSDCHARRCRGEFESTLTLDMRNLVPSLGGATLMPGAYGNHEVGPVDLSPLLARPDILSWELPQLGRATALLGRVELLMVARSAPAIFDVHAWLVQLLPTGRAQLVTDGAAVLGADGSVLIDMSDVALKVDTSTRLALLLGASSFPRFAPTMLLGDPTASANPMQSMDIDLRGSKIRLPVMRRTNWQGQTLDL